MSVSEDGKKYLDKQSVSRKRIGKFWISLNLINENHDEIVSMFHELSIIIVRAEVICSRDAIEYVGVSPNFKEIEPQFVLPEYTLLVHHNHHDGKTDISYSVKEYELFDKETIIK
jgi:hypothetical protein